MRPWVQFPVQKQNKITVPGERCIGKDIPKPAIQNGAQDSRKGIGLYRVTLEHYIYLTVKQSWKDTQLKKIK